MKRINEIIETADKVIEAMNYVIWALKAANNKSDWQGLGEDTLSISIINEWDRGSDIAQDMLYLVHFDYTKELEELWERPEQIRWFPDAVECHYKLMLKKPSIKRARRLRRLYKGIKTTAKKIARTS